MYLARGYFHLGKIIMLFCNIQDGDQLTSSVPGKKNIIGLLCNGKLGAKLDIFFTRVWQFDIKDPNHVT